MFDFFYNLFSEDFMPHGYCYMWNKEVLWLHIVSDLLTALSYYSIPVALLVFIQRRKDIGNFKKVFWLFILFILFCGTTHLIAIYTIWVPAYRLAGLVKAMTALVSVSTAIILWPIIPRALQVPSQRDLAVLNEQLRKEIKKKEASEQALRENQINLEAIVKERTQDLENTNEELRAQIQANSMIQEQIYFQASLLDQAQNPVIAIDLEHKINYWNKLAEKTFGWKEEEALGKKPAELYLTPKEIEKIDIAFQNDNYDDIKWEDDIECITRKGEIIPIHFVSAPIRDAEGKEKGFVTIAFDLRERKKMEDDLRQAKIEAEKAAQAKQDFLSTMSHEIRTPLNAVIGFTELLLLEDPKPEQIDSLQTLKFAGENLLALINDILDFNKIEAQKLALEQVPFSPKILIERLKQLYQPLAKEKNLVIETYLDPKIPSKILGDPLRVSQILTNLISNGIKFTSEGGVKVRLEVLEETDKDCKIKFEVKDSGIGIPEEKQGLIFEAFQQADSNTTRHFGGTGLGLAITQKLIRLHQSEIELKSNPGEGATFSFVLHFPKNTFTLITQKTNPDSTAEIRPILQSKNLILVVEDNPINQIITGRFLEMWGLEVLFAENGEVALELLQEDVQIKEKLAMIFMDIYMPKMDGYTASKEIRALDDFKKTPIVALTASVIDSAKIKITEAGIDDYLSKPFKVEDLKQMLLKYHVGLPKPS